MVETSMEGCEGPHEEENEAALKFTDHDSCTSTRSSLSDMEEDVEDPNATTDFEDGAPVLGELNDSLPPGYFSTEAFTHSPPTSDPGLTSGNDTPPPSPTVQAKIDQEEFDPGTLRPRADGKILTLDSLRPLFPHLTDEELQRMITICESSRDGSYSIAEDPDHTQPHKDH